MNKNQNIRYIIIIITLVLNFKYINSQNYFFNDEYLETPLLVEVGPSFGGIYALTDLGGNKGVGKNSLKDLNLKYTNLNLGFHAGIIYKNYISLHLNYTNGMVEGADSVLRKKNVPVTDRYERNLSFRSRISEFSLTTEIHPLILIYASLKDQPAPRFSPYVTGGIGRFYFNPEAKLGNTWVALQPLRTEGQGFAEYPNRKQYKLNQNNYLLGAGVKYELSPVLNLRFEVVKRFLNTDYLDDVSTTYINPALFSNYLSSVNSARAAALSNRILPGAYQGLEGVQRGDPKDNDSYFTTNIKLSLLLGRLRNNNLKRYQRNVSCYCNF